MKIRIPRKLRNCYFNFDSLQVRKVDKYALYLKVEYAMKYFDMTAEQLVHCFGAYSVDDVIWWNYIRWKHFKIEPQMSKKYKDYWNVIADNENLPKLK